MAPSGALPAYSPDSNILPFSNIFPRDRRQLCSRWISTACESHSLFLSNDSLSHANNVTNYETLVVAVSRRDFLAFGRNASVSTARSVCSRSLRTLIVARTSARDVSRLQDLVNILRRTGNCGATRGLFSSENINCFRISTSICRTLGITRE